MCLLSAFAVYGLNNFLFIVEAALLVDLLCMYLKDYYLVSVNFFILKFSFFSKYLGSIAF